MKFAHFSPGRELSCLQIRLRKAPPEFRMHRFCHGMRNLMANPNKRYYQYKQKILARTASEPR